MESHSTAELMECCMKQIGEDFTDEDKGTCPNCKHTIKKHSNKELAECTLAFFKSNIKNQKINSIQKHRIDVINEQR